MTRKRKKPCFLSIRAVRILYLMAGSLWFYKTVFFEFLEMFSYGFGERNY
jgi:hypothetical protein